MSICVNWKAHKPAVAQELLREFVANPHKQHRVSVYWSCWILREDVEQCSRGGAHAHSPQP